MGNSTSSIASITTTSGSVASPLVIQTVFTPPAACATGISEINAWSTELWNNVIVPAPNATSTSCYPSQFWSSAVATSSLGPFQQLICPLGWGTYQYNSTYIICCPGGYNLYAPNITNTIRPATSAICTSIIWPDVLYDVTSFDANNLNTTLGATAGINGTLVLATPFDGVPASTTLSSSVVSSISPTITSSAQISSSTPTSSLPPSARSTTTVSSATPATGPATLPPPS